MNNIPLSWQFGALVVMLLLSAFFSMSETSLMSLNRYRLRHLVKQGHRGAKLASTLLAKTDKLLGVILLCNNLVNTTLATLATVITVQLLGEKEWVLMLSTVSVTFAILIFSEISPKIIAAAHAERIGIFCSYILYPLLKLLYPVVWFVNLIVAGWLKILGIKVNFGEVANALTMDELRSIVTDAGHFLPKKHRTILLNLFELEKITVDDVMTAHTLVEAIDFDAPLDDILQQISSSHHTRLPVRQGEQEEIIGVLHLRKVMSQLRSHHENNDLDKDALREVISEPYFIPSGTPLYTQMQQFQEKQQRVALVVDEYGEFKGLVTLEDILEEVIGDFTTQSPSRLGSYRKDTDGGWLVDGSSTLRDLNKKLNLRLPLDGPKTLNGLILEHFEDIPESNTSFKVGTHVIEIVQTQDRIVKSVKIFP
ncbi:HlyC/CorC family transporter [Methylotenera sp.]|uniref:HlyC/CorC family transporter n=1 Tax=Methylotenera sp. TaxID=2051956 RepID=UPI002727753E|nr:CNNM domain-containing protein [Methylotenera sp.]MDO9205246.1 CNNM domain-containing protein [Methylotenera sp.]MDO9393179.1 CNNM domain-containing protein [Methylotenera sp.]MDP1521750.1 CNNM domain-containing protein [Methylotenera sp.]MDP2070790.1 CNNM domain-containing protein [Methylotenera sp.]MDP2231348.1 CNNM domain-containing protein [Methylotenera sp.]